MRLPLKDKTKDILIIWLVLNVVTPEIFGILVEFMPMDVSRPIALSLFLILQIAHLYCYKLSKLIFFITPMLNLIALILIDHLSFFLAIWPAVRIWMDYVPFHRGVA